MNVSGRGWDHQIEQTDTGDDPVSSDMAVAFLVTVVLDPGPCFGPRAVGPQGCYGPRAVGPVLDPWQCQTYLGPEVQSLAVPIFDHAELEDLIVYFFRGPDHTLEHLKGQREGADNVRA